MSILTVTVNPALDLSTDVETVTKGAKLRCGPARYDPGGGGVNVSRAIAKLGGNSVPFVAIAGVTGVMLKTLIEQEGIETVWFELDGLTRQSMMVYERSSGEQYRFVLPGPEWDASVAGRMLETLGQTLRARPEPIRYVVASGSLPPGVPDDYYHSISALAEEAGARLILDTSGRALDVAARGGGHAPYIWIMDQAEAEYIGGRPIANLDELEARAKELKAHRLAEIVILSFGEGGAVAVSSEETLRIMPPKVEVLSKVGAGDSFVGGLVMTLARGASLREASSYAVAAAASAVTTPATQLCDGEQAKGYFEQIMNGRT